MKKKLLSNDPNQQEYDAKVAAVSMALASFYQEALNKVVAFEDPNTPLEDVTTMLDNLSIVYAARIVDDISPKKGIIL